MKKAKILSAVMAIAITTTPTIVNTTSNFSKYQNQLTAHAVDDVDENYTGWKFRDGWWYYYVNGKFVTGTKTIDGKKYCFTSGGHMLTHWYRYIGLNYYFGEDGAQRTGWVRIKNDNHFYGDYSAPERYSEKCKNYDEWFYFNKNGIMLTGWHTIDGQRYFFVPDEIEYRELLGDKPEGYMYHGMLQDDGKTYYLDKNGAMATGWKKIGDDWYYFSEEGVMKTGDWLDDRYYFDENGKMLTGEQTIDGKKYVFSSDGDLLNGWKKVGDTWYYYDEDGEKVTNAVKYIDGKYYRFGNDGEMVTYWFKDSKGKTYYFGSDGAGRTGWVKIDGKWYYFDEEGAMQTGVINDNGKIYYTSIDGKMATGWWKINGQKYYFDSNGLAHTGWLEYNGSRYYFSDNGEMLYSCDVVIDDNICTFDENGRWIDYTGAYRITEDLTVPYTEVVYGGATGRIRNKSVRSIQIDKNANLVNYIVISAGTVITLDPYGVVTSYTGNRILLDGFDMLQNSDFHKAIGNSNKIVKITN